jgi:hypothetical protein
VFTALGFCPKLQHSLRMTGAMLLLQA